MKRRALIAILIVLAGAIARLANTASAAGTPTATTLPGGSAEADPVLLGSIDAGYLTDLRWPDFSDYRDYVREFYAADGDALVWSKSGWLHGREPTPAALAIIQELERADAKGLHAVDYDGGRWAARVARFHQSSPPPLSFAMSNAYI